MVIKLSRLLFEGIRSKTFDMHEFRGFETLEEMNEYADEHLQRVGLGSSRRVFVLSSRYALKIANGYDDDGVRGIAQNEEETRLSGIRDIGVIVARVTSHDDEYRWIIQELVRPLKSWKEFDGITGYSHEELLDILVDSFSDYQDFRDNYDVDSELANSDFVAALYKLKDYGLDFSDLEGIQQWGKTADNRVVLLDYGGTSDVLEQYY